MGETLEGFMARIKKQEGKTYILTGKPQQARNRFLEVCRLEPGDAEAWYTLGHLHEQLGANGDAENAYRKALAIDPNLGEAHQYLGNLLSNLGRYTEAIACYRRALQIKPHSVPAHVNLATVLVLQGQYDEAMELYRNALRHEPGSRKAALGIAHVYERQGNYEQAYTQLQPFLEDNNVATDSATIFAALCRPLGRCREAAALLEKLLSRDEKSMKNEQRTAALFRLGHLYDSLNDFDAAFRHFARANDIKSRSRPFHLPTYERHVDALIDIYSKEFMDTEAPRAANDSQRPVFIVGMPRSGTSLVEQILASHPAVFGAGEQTEMHLIAGDLAGFLNSDATYPECVKLLTSDAAGRLAERYLDHVGRLAPPDAERITDKMPANFLHLGLIALMFPKARIIHCMRDPMDTCLSCYFQNFGPANAYKHNLNNLGSYYRQYQRLMAHWRAVLGMSLLEVSYEELVANQEQVSRQIVDFCGLPWDDRCLRFHETERAVATASYEQVRQPMYSRSVGRWRHYARHLGALQQALAGADTQAN